MKHFIKLFSLSTCSLLSVLGLNNLFRNYFYSVSRVLSCDEKSFKIYIKQHVGRITFLFYSLRFKTGDGQIYFPLWTVVRVLRKRQYHSCALFRLPTDVPKYLNYSVPSKQLLAALTLSFRSASWPGYTRVRSSVMRSRAAGELAPHVNSQLILRHCIPSRKTRILTNTTVRTSNLTNRYDCVLRSFCLVTLQFCIHLSSVHPKSALKKSIPRKILLH